MKISLVYIGTTGAGPVYSYEMARALANSHRCQLQVIVSENVENLSVWKNEFENSNVSFHIVKTYKRNKLSVFLNTFNIVRKYRIYAIIKAFNPDVLYSPFVLLWERFLFGMLHKKTHNVTTIHDVKLHDSYHNIEELMTKFLNYGSMRFTDSIVILNKKDLPYVEQKYKLPTIVIPHASFSYYVNNEDIDYHLKHSICFIGRIEPYKGLDLLVDAFEQVKTPGLSLVIAGKGNIEHYLLQKIKGNEKITLINKYLSEEEIANIIQKSDIAILPYKRASQSGIIPLCFANGRMVIATNVGALEEQIPQGTGILINPSVEEIALSIDKLYSQPELICKYGKNAYDYAITQLTWEKSADILINHLSSVLNKNTL